MKKVLLALGTLLIVLSPAANVSAGSLNTYENEVIAAANQTYEYNGVKYQVDPSFINQMVDYLSTDGVDLTAEQRDEVMQTAFANIEQGITGGYLIPIPGQELPASGSGGSNTNDGNIGQETGGATGNTSSDPNAAGDNGNQKDTQEEKQQEENDANDKVGNTDSSKESTEGNAENTDVTTGKNADTNANADQDAEENLGGSTAENITHNTAPVSDTAKNGEHSTKGSDLGSTITSKEPDSTGDPMISEIKEVVGTGNQVDKDSSITNEDKEATVSGIGVVQGSDIEGSDTVTDGKEGNLDTEIIKQTGFDFRNTVIMIAGMGMLMFAGIYVTMKSGLFAQRHER